MRYLLVILPILAACAAGTAPAEPGSGESLLPGSIGVLVARKDQGVVVTGVSSAAADAGLREGDLILRYNGVELLRGGAVHVLHVPVRQIDTMPRA